MRCLILGATGLIGSHLAAECATRRMAWLGTSYRNSDPDFAPLDVRDEESVHELLSDYQPDVTFLAAGFSCPQFVERHAESCRSVLLDGTQHVAEAVARQGGSLVMFSSDAVFGECSTARNESAELDPRGEFAELKVAAEAIVRDSLPERHLILRTG